MNDIATPRGKGKRLSEWLQLMLGEIERKRHDLEAASAEQQRRAAPDNTPPPPTRE